MHSAVKQVDAAEKVIDEWTGRMVIDIFRRSDLLNPPGVHDDHPIRDLKGFILIMGDEHARHMEVIVQSPEPTAKFLSNFGIKGAEGLIEQQYAGLHRQGSGQRDPLALPAGQLSGMAIPKPFQLDQLE